MSKNLITKGRTRTEAIKRNKEVIERKLKGTKTQGGITDAKRKAKAVHKKRVEQRERQR